jgi:hypothetical protein
MMGSLPTCWYCPECGNVSNIKPPGAHLNARTWLQCSGVHVESLVFPPGTPLSVIVPVLVVDNPATDERA